MFSNHSNLYITLLALVLRALRSIHAEVNGTEDEKGDNRDMNRDGNGEVGLTGAEQGRERRNGRWARGGGGRGGRVKKRSPLVGDL